MTGAGSSEIVAIIEQHLVVLRRKAILGEGAGFGECFREFDRSEQPFGMPMFPKSMGEDDLLAED